MKKILQLLLLTLLFMGSASCQKKTYTFAVSHLQPYCGGAHPTPEMEEQANTPKPYAFRWIMFVAEKGGVDSVLTDAKGQAKVKLKAGNYKVYEGWKFHKKTANGENISGFDQECLNNEWKKPFMTVSVTGKKVTQNSDGPIILYCAWNAPCQNETNLPPTRPQ